MLGDGFRLLDSEPGVVAFARGEHTVLVNTSSEPRQLPAGQLVLTTHEGDGLQPHASAVLRN